MPLVRIEESDKLKKLHEEGSTLYEALTKEYRYVFDPPGSELDGFPGIRFAGFIPNDAYLERLCGHLSDLGIKGPLMVQTQPAPVYAETFAECHPNYHRARHAGLPEEYMEKLRESLRALSQNTGGFFSANSDPSLVVLNCDSQNWQEAMLEELLHIAVLRKGWLRPLESAVKSTGHDLLPQHTSQGEVLFIVQTGIIDWMSYAVAVEQNMPDFCISSAKTYLDKVLKLPERTAYLHGSFTEALHLVHKTTPPPNYRNGDALRSSLKTKCREVVDRLHPKVRPLVPQLYRYFDGLQLPPRTSNLQICIYHVFDDYLSLPQKEMEYAKDLDQSNICMPWDVGGRI